MPAYRTSLFENFPKYNTVLFNFITLFHLNESIFKYLKNEKYFLKFNQKCPNKY